ncbi:hypothetical protein [Streptomyces sp. CC210A]|uniref:hypothetical protein n=1 Tax=Streptomyces sp. CC210A TaxID=2898184 RepID=UPI001F34DB1A|nr:hypothetical protein [Streptomyces sp. CC210A]
MGEIVAESGRRLLRACGALSAAAVVLVVGCSSEGGRTAKGTADTQPGAGAGTRGSSPPAAEAPAAAPSAPVTPTALDFTPDPGRAPKTAADARRMALAVVAGPDAWGADYVERVPHLADGFWPVLGGDCTWRTGVSPATVLHSVTARSEVPASAGRAALRVAATVTVHRTETDADWEMARTLEEALRCPDQILGPGERVTALRSIGSPFGTGGNFTATDSLGEMGTYRSSAFKGGQKYTWFQSRVGQVTVATVVKGAPGHGEQEVTHAQVQALVAMTDRAKAQLEAPR